MTAGAARRVTDDERRARLAVRHALATEHRVADAVAAARAVVALHATDPPSVHLSCWARSHEVGPAEVEAALGARDLLRHPAMRQTLFAFPTGALAAVWGSIGARHAAAHRRRLVRDVERHEFAADGEAWLGAATDAVLDRLADGRARSVRTLREEVPQLAGSYEQGAGTRWASTVQLAPRVLAQLNLEARVVRGENDGPWFTSRPRYTATDRWFEDPPRPLDARTGYRELVGRWLRCYGPGTVDDVRWWLGGTAREVRTALADLDAAAVRVDDGGDGAEAWLLPDDLDPVASPGHWVALLPLLDPTVMGWRHRDFLLGPHAGQLFDSIGNAGTTALVDGRAVGAWVQDDAGRVVVRLLEDVGRSARDALDAEARRLTDVLDGQRVFTVYPSPAMQG